MLAFAACGRAALVISTNNEYGALPFTPTWKPATNSLIAGLAPSTASGNFSEEISGRNVDSLTAGGTLAITSVGNPATCSTNYVTCGNGNGAGSLVIYTLPASTYGYNITNITVDSGWQDNGRDEQAYTVSFSTALNPTAFTVLTAVNFNPPVPNQTPSANQVMLSDSAGGLIASNVAAIKFDFTTPASENGYVGYGAITVQGTAATTFIVPAFVTTTTNQYGAEPLTPSWTPATNSLIAGLAPSTAVGNFSEEISGRSADSLTAGGSLTITSEDGTCSTNYVTCGNGYGAGSLLIYKLPASTYGYNITNITVDSGWQDNGRDAQAYTISYSTVATSGVSNVLASVNYNPTVPPNMASANQVMLASSLTGGLIASNVGAIQFNFTTPASENGYLGYGAITVQGMMATNLLVPPVAPAITSQPLSTTLYAGATATFTVTVTGAPLFFQWQYISNRVTNAIAGATNSSLTISNVTAANAGSYQLFVTNSIGYAYSSVAVLTVITLAASSYASAVLANGPLAFWQLNETNNPAVGGVVAYDYVGGFNGVYQTGARNGYNGVLGPQPPNFPGFPSNNTTMETFANMTNSYVTASVGSMVASNLTYAMWINPSGPVESYAGLLMDRGAAGEGFGFGGNANASGMYELTYTWNQNTTSGFNSSLFPPVNQWSFVAMVISPAQTVLYLINSNGVQAATNLLANDAEEFGVAWHLGDDGVFGGGVRTFPGMIDQAAVFISALSESQLLNLYDNGVGAPPQPSTPSASPSNNLYIGNSVVFSEQALGATPFQYQWETNGTILPGATNNSLALTNLSLTASGDYQVIVSNLYGVATSSPVRLSVTHDTNPPVVLRAFNIGATNVELDYSKIVQAPSASNPANYSFINGLAVSSASLATNESSVLLTTAPIVDGSNYTLVINGVLDQAIPPNTIASNTTVSFTASPFAPLDIGNPAIASTDIYTTGGWIISSAGSNIAGASDQFNFDYELVTGNFDVTVCLAGLSLDDLWAQAGWMARANLGADSPFAAALATPSINGDSFTYRAATNGTAAATGSFPVNYPNTWLRLNRIGNVFAGFGGYDGTNWTQLGSAKIAMPAQIYLGFAVAAGGSNQVTTAQFVNYENTLTNAVIAAQINPHDAIGPTSRMTPIVFSEIMWKPAPRTDGKNLEFLEIYNANPWFQDISSYQITCADVYYTFPAGTTIAGGAYLVVAAVPADMESVYGITNVLGPYNGSLKHSETLELLDEQTNVLLTVPYTDVFPWPVATDGTGHSLILANPTYGEGDARAWDISDVVGGSPGRMDSFTPSPLRNVVINEILAHSENLVVPQFIELYNHSTNTVNVSGCILTDDPTTNKFVIPTNTVIGPAGFVSFTQWQTGFTLNGQGDTIYFIKPDGSRVLDAVQFGAQADGVSYGRWPNGANDFYAFTTNTPGSNNSMIVIGDVVINELMYDPISGNEDDEFIELYNKGTNTINLSGWQFTSGVTFTFPTNASISPNGYVVIGKDMTELFSNYPSLNAANTYGNFSGKLSHNGELVVLSQPKSYFGTNTIYVEEDEVAFGTGGRWGEWSGGGGSSLELIDPHSNHRLAANWADSDETQKSSWVLVQNTGVLDNGANYDPSIDYAQIGLLDDGECLVDNIVVNYNGSNYVSNGTFDNGLGLTNWSLQGCMTCSSLESSGYQSASSLHIRCSDKLWTGDNSCEVALNSNSMAAGDTVTMSYMARWLRGTPEPDFRLNGNWLEAPAVLPVPANLGTPGAPNSQYIANAGPAMYNVTHTPSVPAANQAVVVTTQAHDPDGIQSLMLYYRLDPATNYTLVPMNDAGTNGDAVAGDGIFSATILGQAANQIVAFYISAADTLGAATRFPALRTNNNVPAPECVVMFGDGNPGGSFGVYHLWITQTNVTRWANLGNVSRDWNNDLTFVNGNRVIYNLGGRFSGSPAHQDYNTPNGNLCAYELKFNADDVFLGTTDLKKLHQPGNTPGDDPSIQREQIANTFLRALGVPWLNRRYVAVYVNGNRRLTLMEDAQEPDSDVVKEHYPNDPDGFLFKMQPWFEMAPFLSGYTIGADNLSWCTLNDYTTTGGPKKAARYRFQYEIRRTPDTYSDFTNVFSLIDAANSYGTPGYVANMENMANMENWMRVFAANHAGGNWDSFGAQNEQNLYGYIGALGTKYSLHMWDFNITIGNSGPGYSSWSPGQNLFYVNPSDPNMSDIYNTPVFRRMYWRALQDLVNGPLNVANSGPLIMAKYNAFTENGLSVENPTVNIEPWLSQAQSSIASQLAAVNATNFAVSSNVMVSNNVAYVTGTAPVSVETVWINGEAWPITWTTLTNWVLAVPLHSGTNQFNVTGIATNGVAIAGDSGNLSVVYNAAVPSPLGVVVINEIMYDPLMTNAVFIELYNNSSNTTFDLSGWQMPAVGYTFSNGASLGPDAFLVLAASQPAYAGAYGVTNTVFDTFPGTLTPGRLLALLQPNGSSNTVVAEVQFDSVLPWPTNTAGTGYSLQLIDPHQDNWRVGNWASQIAHPGATNAVAASLTPFQPLWLNEIEPDNLTGITNSAGQRAPWIELYNPSTNKVSLTGLYLSDNYTNLGQWPFLTNAVIAPGQFMVIFADGLTNLSTTNQLHTSFVLPGASGSLALSRMTNSQYQVLDYLNYSNVPPNDSYGSFPDGQSFVRQIFYQATPGGTNNGSAVPPPSFVPYQIPGSVYAQNFDSLPDPGSASVDSGNPVTIDGITYSLPNPYDFAFPVSASGNNGGLGLGAMAGWYGLASPSASVGVRFGATDGDQTTGGQISFGPENGSNRALGLLATSTTRYTACGLKLINGTGQGLNYMNLQCTSEVWRQSNLAKTLEFYYFIDPTGTNPFTTSATAFLSALNVNFPTVSGDVGGAAVDGTATNNQAVLAVVNQPMTNWPAGGALWLVWEMASSTGKSQGLGIDNLSFSATAQAVLSAVSMTAQAIGTNVVLIWPGLTGQMYQVQYKINLTDATWLPLNSPVQGTGASLSLTNSLGGAPQRFYRLAILPPDS